MKRLWLYLINTFEVNTRKSFRKMLSLATDHDARLNAAKDDPAILQLYTPFHEELTDYKKLMSQWGSGKNVGMGNTVEWTKKVDKMTKEKMSLWENIIHTIYPKGTKEATAIFPHAKSPFNSGNYEERLVALEAFHTTVLLFPGLETIASEVETTLNDLNKVRQEQREQHGKVGFISTQLEVQRIVLADLMDDNLSALKTKYRPNMSMVENFFNLSLLRRPASDADLMFRYSGSVVGGATAVVGLPPKLTMSANATCTFTNNSNQGELQFFFSASASAGDGPVKTSVLPNESSEGAAAESGWAPGMNYIIVKNPGQLTNEFEIMVIEAIV